MKTKMYWNADPKPTKQAKDLNTFAKAMTKLAKRKPIRKVSKVRAKELKTYGQKRKEFLEAHPVCQASLRGCTKVATQIHHASKRGKNLNNKETFLAVCMTCHEIIETILSASKRRELGFLK